MILNKIKLRCQQDCFIAQFRSDIVLDTNMKLGTSLRGKHVFGMSENKVLKISGHERGEVTKHTR
jgi:hypothetical protein